MNAEQFLNALEKVGYLDPQKITRLRKTLSQTGEYASAKKLARTLIRGGYISEYQALKILSRLKKARSDSESVSNPQADPLIDLQPIEEDADEVLVPLEAIEDFDGRRLDNSLGTDDADTEDLWEDVSKTQPDLNIAKTAKQVKSAFWSQFRSGSSRYRKRGNQWDSPLMLFGGGGLLLLSLIGVALFFYLTGETGDELFQAAQDDYAAQSYGHAISKYGKYLEKFPQHPEVSLARVRRGLARIRQVVERGNSWRDALTNANKVLPEIRSEAAFDKARTELSGILPEIYDGFVAEAESVSSFDEKERLLEKAVESLTLVNNSEYLPTSQRRSQQAKIDRTNERVALIHRDIEREKELDATLEKIEAAIVANNTQKAFAARDDLLKAYPGLRTNSRLDNSILDVTAKQSELVEVISGKVESSNSDHGLTGIQTVVLADTQGDQAQGVEGKTIASFVQGAVYGLDAITGNIHWRRWVGLESPMYPLEINGDYLVMDRDRNELLRLAGATGELVWRLPATGMVAAPVVSGGRIYLPDTNGQLLVIDNLGTIQTHVTFPQSISTSPTIDNNAKLIYQIADHSSFYVLDQQSLECQSVQYIGHRPGSVVTPPVLCSGFIFISQNDGVDFSIWQVFKFNQKQSKLFPIGNPHRLDGHVVTPPVVFDQRVLVTTDRGAIYIFEVDPASEEDAVRLLAEKVATAKQPIIGFPLVDQRAVYFGHDSLVRWDLDTGRGTLIRKWIVDDGDPQLAPLQQHGNYLYHVRKSHRTGSFFVSAISLDGQQKHQRIWQTEIAISPATEPFMNLHNHRVVVLSSTGKAWEIDDSHITSGVSGPAVGDVVDARRTVWTQPITLTNGTRVLSPAAAGMRLPKNNVMNDNVLVYKPQGQGSVRPLVLEIEKRQKQNGWTMASLGDELLVCTSAGPVYALNGESGKQSVLPFHPTIVANQTSQWLRPAVVNPFERRFAIARTDGIIYLVAQQPAPDHLVAVAQAELPSGWMGSIAAVGNALYVVNNAQVPANVLSYSTGDLHEQQQFQIDGNAVWGPARVGSSVLMTTDRRRLYCFGGQHNLKWDVELGFGPLSGAPLEVGTELVFSSIDGKIWRRQGTNGEMLAWTEKSEFLDVGQPLGSGPALSAERLLLLCPDGTLLVVEAPPGLGGV